MIETRFLFLATALLATMSFANQAEAVRYQRESGASATATLGGSCLAYEDNYVERPNGICYSPSRSDITLSIPTEYQSTSQYRTAWIHTYGGVDFAILYAFYKDGTYASGSNYNSASRLAADTEYSTNVYLPADGFMTIYAALEDGDGVASYAWAVDF